MQTYVIEATTQGSGRLTLDHVPYPLRGMPILYNRPTELVAKDNRKLCRNPCPPGMVE